MDDSLFHGDVVSSIRNIYTPSAFAKSSLMYIQEIGELEAKKPHISKRDGLQSLLFFIVQSGSGSLNYSGTNYTLSAGDCVFIDCTKPYYHESSNDLWSLKWIHMYGPTANSLYEKYVERGGSPTFHPENLFKYIKAWSNIYLRVSENSFVKDMRINEELFSLLTLLMEDSWQDSSSDNSRKRIDISEIAKYLDENYTKKITLDDLSKRYFVNKFYLTRIFKEAYQVSINTYILNLRITHAKRLLRFSSKSIEDIGKETGMGELYYFSRTFKKVEGISPSEYRSTWNG